jgi:hypothetical protein
MSSRAATKLRPVLESSHARDNRRYRARLKRGLITVPVEIGPEVVDLLVKARWLPELDLHSRAEFGAAIAAMLADSARARR